MLQQIQSHFWEVNRTKHPISPGIDICEKHLFFIGTEFFMFPQDDLRLQNVNDTIFHQLVRKRSKQLYYVHKEGAVLIECDYDELTSLENYSVESLSGSVAGRDEKKLGKSDSVIEITLRVV